MRTLHGHSELLLAENLQAKILKELDVAGFRPDDHLLLSLRTPFRLLILSILNILDRFNKDQPIGCTGIPQELVHMFWLEVAESPYT